MTYYRKPKGVKYMTKKDTSKEVPNTSVDYAVMPEYGTGTIRTYVLHTRDGMYRPCIDYSRAVVEFNPTGEGLCYGQHDTKTLEGALLQLEQSSLQHVACPLKTNRQPSPGVSLDAKIVDRNATTVILKPHKKKDQEE